MKTRIKFTNRSTLHLLAAAGAALLVWAPSASGAVEIINLRSGWIAGASGIPGQAEDDITFDPGAVKTLGGQIIGSAFSVSDFTDAKPIASGGNGVVATVVKPYPGWIASLPADPAARWIDWKIGGGYNEYGRVGSALYAMPFTVNSSTIASASLTLNWAVDDRLGDLAQEPNPIGVYINGKPTTISGGVINAQTTASYIIPPADLVGGGATNWIYFYQRDTAYQASGLIFGAQFNVIPGPGSAALLGLAGVVAARRRRPHP